MTDRSDAEGGPDPGRRTDGGPPSMPRWVKVSLVVLAAIAVLVVVALATGNHGPSRHGASHAVETAARGAGPR